MFINTQEVQDPILKSMHLLEEHQVDIFLQQLTQIEQPTSLGFINQHAYNLMQQDSQTQLNFNQLTYRLRDGSGMAMCCKLNKCPSGANLNGTDFIPRLINHITTSHQGTIKYYVFGTEEPWLTTGATQLLNGATCTTHHGFAPAQQYVGKLTVQPQAQLNIVILAMGMPKQEQVCQLLTTQLTGPWLIICGGAVVDFYANRFTRAPKILRQIGCEWLYRLIKEPKRLFARYIIGIPLFFSRIFINRLTKVG
ncbi:WecB/TagA/CpsF glycosyl transferase [Catenovulum agarivorans DS-2]|uniref:WecB/TagA/CpsF glycosyl transferase n=1 Tax=Catenovulum agarivorans DS-2 TaxID=1328313 RepID=W7QBP1_9ALTE|nr:WecB/TagA/CpsF family glycosyltransferase [Catenovulum agarivorans]EWH09411.1 WecB/TagA/CpsF glycosyl transferase [Catenovulum agarivorans DS-2]